MKKNIICQISSIIQSVKSAKVLYLIISLSFLASLAYAFYFRINPVVDAKAYDAIAVNLAEGYGFREDRTASYEFDKAIVRAGPGYEYFLAGLYKVFGHLPAELKGATEPQRSGGEAADREAGRYEPVWIIQALLHALSVWLIYLICLRVFETPPAPSPIRGGTLLKTSSPYKGEARRGSAIALIAASLFAFWPDLIEISAMLMTETLYLFFTVLVAYLFVRAYQTPANKKLAFLLGTATGLAVLTRPTIIFFAPITFFLYYRQLSQSYRNCIAVIAIYLVSLIAVLTPWTARNYRIYHQFIPTTMIGEYNLWVGNTLNSDGGQISGGFNPLTSYTDAHGFFGLKQKAGQEFRGFLFSHPAAFIRLCLIRAMRFFSLIRPMGFWFYQNGIGQTLIVGSSLVWIAGVFMAGFTGMALFIKNKHPLAWYLAAMAFTVPLLLIPTVVQSRYRFGIYPFLSMFAAYFIVRGCKDARQMKLWWWPGLALLALSLIDIGLSGGKIIERIAIFL